MVILADHNGHVTVQRDAVTQARRAMFECIDRLAHQRLQALEEFIRRLLDAHDEFVVALHRNGDLVLKIFIAQSHGGLIINTVARLCKNRSAIRCEDATFLRLADRQLDTALDDSGGDGVAGETGDLVDVELGHEILPVFFDGFDADAEFRRGLFVGLAFGNQLEHL